MPIIQVVHHVVGSLGLPHIVVEPMKPQETLVIALFRDVAVAQHDDQICVSHSSQPWRVASVLQETSRVGMIPHLCAMKMLVREFVTRFELMFFMSSASVCPSSADV